MAQLTKKQLDYYTAIDKKGIGAATFTDSTNFSAYVPEQSSINPSFSLIPTEPIIATEEDTSTKTDLKKYLPYAAAAGVGL